MTAAHSVSFALISLATAGVARPAESPVWTGEDYGGVPHLVTVAGCRAFILVPRQANSAHAGAWVWYALAIAGNPHPCVHWLFSNLLANGVAVAGIDVGETYANPSARRQFWEFCQFVQAQFHLGPKACLLAQSRGGLNQYHFAASHPGSVQCIAGIYPVMDMRSYPGIQRAADAYGVKAEEFEAHLAENNPIDNLVSIAAAHIPVMHLHGDSDKIVPFAINTAVAQERYRRLGGEMKVVIMKGKGHEEISDFFESQDLLGFLLQNARPQ